MLRPWILVVGALVAVGLVACGSSQRRATKIPAAHRQARHVGGPAVRRKVRGAHDSPVPVLMYHAISAPPPGVAYPDLYTAPAGFAAEMQWLAGRGYHGVTLRQVYDYWHSGFALPARPIVISFDDGYRSQYLRAYPVLRSHAWPGVLNLKVGNERDYWGLPPPLVRRLIAAGWEVDAHTITHPDLTRVDAAQLVREIAGSRDSIRREFHVPVDFFCYPSGRYDDRVIAEVRAAGYVGATTTNYGLARPDEPFTLSRVRINGSDTVAGFATKLRALG